MTQEQMQQRISEAYPDADLVVMDLTGTQDHWEVRISDKSLNELPRIKRHKAIMGLFSEELASGEVHALSIRTL